MVPNSKSEYEYGILMSWSLSSCLNYTDMFHGRTIRMGLLSYEKESNGRDLVLTMCVPGHLKHTKHGVSSQPVVMYQRHLGDNHYTNM